MTEAGAKRASTRSTRASQERKEILEAAQALPLVPEAALAAKETAESAEVGDTGADESVVESGGEPRRSSRRAAASAAPKTTTQATSVGETVVEAPSGEPQEAVEPKEVAQFVLGGGSLAAAAARFGLSRAEVTKIVKETTVATAGNAAARVSTNPSGGADAVPQGVASDASTEEDEQSAKKSRRPGVGSPTADDALKTTKEVAEVIPTPIESIPVPSAQPVTDEPMPPVTDAPMPTMLAPSVALALGVTNDLKRSAVDANGMPIAPKAKRVRKTREEKLAILAFVDEGGTHVAAAEKFGVSRTAVTKMVKERDIIMSGLTTKHSAHVATQPSQAAPLPAATGGSPLHAAAAIGVTAVSTDSSTVSAQRKSRVGSGASTPLAGRAPPAATPPNATGATKARRVRKTNEEKLLILEFVERGGSQGAAAEKFGVSRTAVTKMVKEKEAITAQVMSGKSNHRKVLQYQHKLSIIEDMLYKWQVQVENDAPNLKITGDLLQSKAVEFRDKILAEWKNSLEPEVVQSLTDFKASNGWLHRYLQRRNLRTASKREYHRRTGSGSGPSTPGSPSDPFNVAIFFTDLTHRLKPVPVQCIWNLDEVALLPKTVVSPGPKEAVSEEAAAMTERMTVTLLVNAAGEKFKPQVLIKEPDISKVEALQKAQPELILTTQMNAWQDTTALALYLHAVSTLARERSETWYILMDASASHTEFAQLVDPDGSFERGYRFESLVLILLPPTSPHDRHPIHHGISRVFKAAYRQAMLSTVVRKWQAHKQQHEANPSGAVESSSILPFELQTQIGTADEMEFVTHAWDAVPPPLIRHCWVRNGLLSPTQLAQISQDNSRTIEGELYHSLSETLTVLREQDNGAIAQALGLPLQAPMADGTPGATLDQVNSLITLDDEEPTERTVETGVQPSSASQVITETDANGDLRALV